MNNHIILFGKLSKCLLGTFNRPFISVLHGLFLLMVCLLISRQALADISVDSSCSLQNAIHSANLNLPVGGCSTGVNGVADIINLETDSDHILSGINNTINGDNGLPSISTEIVIQGNGATIRRSTFQDILKFRLFHVASIGNLTLNDVTLSNGFNTNIGNTGGGAIYVDDGGVSTLNNCTIIDNNSSDIGGGIAADGTLTLNNSLVTGNHAQDNGGGIYMSSGTLSLNNSTVSANTADGAGGGISIDTDLVVINNSTISNNSSGSNGGGIYDSNSDDDQETTISNTTISGNSSVFDGGGLYAAFHGVSIISSTITDNTSIPDSSNNFQRGAGMYIDDDDSSVSNTIIANNSGADNGDNDCYIPPNNMPAVNISNWFGDDSCDGTAQGDPKLGPLADNGGPTLTHALLSGSGAINAGDISTCLVAPTSNFDQRGFIRTKPFEFVCDIGAFERIPPIVVSGDCTLAEAITAANIGGATEHCSTGSTNPDTIILNEDVLLSVVDNSTDGNNMLPSITSDIRIEGSGASIARDGNTVSPARLFHVAINGDLTLSNVTLSGGSASTGNQNGGAIYNLNNVSLLNSTLEGNTASNNGGGIYSGLFGTVLIDKSTLSGNNAINGGGVYLNASNAVISNSTLSDNTASFAGGAMYNTNFSDVDLNHVTVSHNSANNIGGGLRNLNATVTLSNSIIANSPSGAQCENDLTLLIENGNNWFEDASCNGVAQGDPKLGPLQNNGGPGKSHAPLAGSGVIDAADNTICAAQPINNEDQRGRARPVGDACDIGAIEDAGESFYVIPLANGKSVIIVL